MFPKQTRITKIEKVGKKYKVHVNVFSQSMESDAYEYSGYILYNDITEYDRDTSVRLVVKTS